MRNRFQRRMMALVAAIVLAGVGIGCLTVRLQQEVSELRTRIKQVDSESFSIADQFGENLRQLNDSLYHCGRSQVDPDEAAFNTATHELDVWIDAQKPRLTSDRERAVMDQIDVAYDDYMNAAKKLVKRLKTLGSVSAPMDEYTDLRKESQRLFRLGQALGRAHLASRDQVLASVSTATKRLRALVLTSLGLLFLLALVLGVVVYRDLILPMRVKLVESESLRDRQEKLASLGVLAAGVAHEVRNPLTAIKGVLFLQQKELSPGSKQYADTKVVEREILRLERIVNDFLRFARPGDCKLEPMTADTPLREVQGLLAPELARAGTQLILADVRPLPVKADGEQLKQVLINLVRNAAEAIDHDGVIKLRTRLDRRPLAGQETKVVILEVEDNGKGISAETEKRFLTRSLRPRTREPGWGYRLLAASSMITVGFWNIKPRRDWGRRLE